MMPDHPYCPKCPVFGGINGCQLATMCDQCPNAKTPANPIKNRTIATLIITAALVKLADSRTPITRTAVITTIAESAKTSTCALSVCPNNVRWSAGVGSNGSFVPKKPSRLLTNPLQPTATVAAPKAYSSTSAQPMIQATISPMVE